jgi:pimeloyl-ACP methyl ester carboxylesterase
MTGAAIGRSSQPGSGHDMDHYADDLAALTAHLDFKHAVHVGHSTGGGEVVHYISRAMVKAAWRKQRSSARCRR